MKYQKIDFFHHRFYRRFRFQIFFFSIFDIFEYLDKVQNKPIETDSKVYGNNDVPFEKIET